jgi:hypothetical protein
VKGFGYVAAFFMALLFLAFFFRKKLIAVMVDAIIKNILK